MAFLKRLKLFKRTKKRRNQDREGQKTSAYSSQSLFLDTNIESNLKYLKEIFQDCSDVVFREFLFAQKEQIKLVLIYTDGMTSKSQVSDQIMRALALEMPVATDKDLITKTNALYYIKMRGLCVHQVNETQKVEEVVDAVLSGDTVLLVDGHATALINGSRGWESRSIEESSTESVVRGPRESFVETLRTNTSLIRRRIKSPNLKIETLKLGKITKTDIALVYIKGVVNEGLVDEVKKRLSRIKIDGVLESGYIEELIGDSPYSPFPTVAHTERPDRVAGYLLEGRVAILVDGTPIVLLVPTFFVETIQTPDDYYERSTIVVPVRVLRLLALVMVLTLPSFYIAIVSYHQEMLPTPLLLSIAAQREAVPFPVFAETLIMEVAFEIIREAGIRLPRAVGQAVSIVAALIVGEAAVRAGMVSASTVIVVALTAMTSFTVYYYASMSLRLLRFPMMALAASLGLFGLISGIIVIMVHLASLRSFGVPYLAPFAPVTPGDLKDTLVRVPWWSMRRRPFFVGQNNPQREVSGMRPKPPQPRK